MMSKNLTRGETRPLFISVPGDALVAIMRAGHLLQEAGDLGGAIALYENFITTLKTCELTPIEDLEWCVPVPDPVRPGKTMLQFSMVRSHPSQYTIA